MARGNRGRRSNPAPPPLPPGASVQQLDPATALAAYEHMRRGTHAKAHRILQKAMDKIGGLESSPPFLLHAYSTVHKGAADISADRKIRARHFKSAVEAARRAAEIAPDSMVLAHSYAMVLLGASRDMNDHDAMAAYQSIIAECERGIQIKDPSDPTLYHLVPTDSDHPTADGVLSELRELQQLVREDLEGMERYNETKLKIAEFQRQTSLTPPTAGHCADQGKGDLEQSHEVINDSGNRKGSVPQNSADGETSEKIENHLDSFNDFGCNFSKTAAYLNEQEEKTPADETVECPLRTHDELNFKQFEEQSGSTSTPFEQKVRGSGLKSDDDDKNCLLNVIIQSLWHLRGFTDELLKTSSCHKHVGDPRGVSCVVCALCHLFIELDKVSEGKGEAVAPTSLTMSLSISSPTETLFQMRPINDASEVLEAILRCVHDSYTYRAECHAKSHESNHTVSSDCANKDCIAHNIFGAGVFTRINCYNCGLESRKLKHTLFLHHINAASLQRAMRMCPDNAFDDLVKTVIIDDHRTCDPDAGGCGKSNHTKHTLSSSPRVFTVVLGWQSGNGSASDTLLTDILAAIGTKIDISIIYPGTTPRSKHCLVSVACFYSQRYICFALDGEQWVLYDGQTARIVGDWIQVLITCEEKKMQPLVLFFEAAN